MRRHFLLLLLMELLWVFSTGNGSTQTSSVLYDCLSAAQPSDNDPTVPGPPRNSEISGSQLIIDDIRIPVARMNHPEDDQIVVTKVSVIEWVKTFGLSPQDTNNGWVANFYLYSCTSGTNAVPNVANGHLTHFERVGATVRPVGLTVVPITWADNIALMPARLGNNGDAIIFLGYSALETNFPQWTASTMGLAYAVGPEQPYNYAGFYSYNSSIVPDGWVNAPRPMPFAIRIEGYSRLTRPPVTTSVSPTSMAAGSGSFILTVNGTDFRSGATVLWNGNTLPTSYVSATKLTAKVPASYVFCPTTAPIAVRNPTGTTTGATSNAQTVTITGDHCVLYVDRSASGSEEGSATNPFHSLALALNAADAIMPTNIYIRAGSYNEQPTISKPITLINWTSSGIVSIGTP